MKDPTSDGKGFGGLSGLSGRGNPPVPNKSQEEPQQPTAEVSTAGVESVSPQLMSQTVAPKWHRIVILGVLGLVGLALIAAVIQKPSNSKADTAAEAAVAATEAQSAADAAVAAGDAAVADAAQAAADSAAAAADAAAAAADAAIASRATTDIANSLENEQTPGVGIDQVLYAPQIRYCVYEKIRLDAAEKVVDTYDGDSVDRFNAMVNDYNSRCSSFRYPTGTLESIQREAESIRGQLEAQGRNRFAVTERAADPIAQRSGAPTLEQGNDHVVGDEVAPSDPEYSKNLNTCLSGSYQILCKHGMLTPEDAARVERMELAKNFETCISGRYPILCKHDRLTAEQADSVERAELDRNYETCISGRYPMLCKHEKLTPDQAGRVEQAELDRNYETCISGRYPMLCKHGLLTAEQAEAVAAAERR